jgi:hypothetical protein
MIEALSLSFDTGSVDDDGGGGEVDIDEADESVLQRDTCDLLYFTASGRALSYANRLPFSPFLDEQRSGERKVYTEFAHLLKHQYAAHWAKGVRNVRANNQASVARQAQLRAALVASRREAEKTAAANEAAATAPANKSDSPFSFWQPPADTIALMPLPATAVVVTPAVTPTATPTVTPTVTSAALSEKDDLAARIAAIKASLGQTTTPRRWRQLQQHQWRRRR